MKNIIKTLLFVAVTISIVSCGGNKDSKENKNAKDTAAAVSAPPKPYSEEVNGIKVTEAPNSPEFPDAKLKLISPPKDTILKAGEYPFHFHVENYTLGSMTEGYFKMHCANSAKGQHIHFIMDNTPYFASYDSAFKRPVANGKHLLLSFLSRSYHESIKNKDAYILTQLVAGKKTDTIPDFDLNAQYLFYSRPKGDYVGDEETKKLLLDFYLVNTTISPDGNKVKATINGNEFILTKWVPYMIEGLPMGDNKIDLQLIDKDGKLIPGIFNDSGDRKFTLKPKAK
jgi:hypothetical protein